MSAANPQTTIDKMKSSSARCKISGWIITVLFGVTFVYGLFDLGSEGAIPGIIFLAILVFAGIHLIRKGNRKAILIKNFYLYSSYFHTDPTHSIDRLAQSLGVNPSDVGDNLTAMIEAELFKNAYIDRDRNCLVFPEMSPDNSYVNPSGSPSTQPAHTVTVQCTGCGATNEVAAGKTGKCEYCGSSITA